MKSHPSLTKQDLAMFARHKIPAELVAEAGIRRVTETEARHSRIRAPKNWDLSGVLFPYNDIDGDEIITCRLRRDNPEKEKDGKFKNKYLMPPAEAARRILYYPPGSAKKLKQEVPIVLVEAEKSALALTAWSARVKFSVLPLAMGGCWGWSQNKKMMPDMSVCDRRKVFVLLDANVADNENVRRAQDELVADLLGRNCAAFILTLPQIESVNGPDDLLTLPDGDERMRTVFDSGIPGVAAPYSDDALATRFAEAQQNDLRYVHDWGKWIVWDGQRWKQDSDREAGRRVQDFCREVASEGVKLAEAPWTKQCGDA